MEDFSEEEINEPSFSLHDFKKWMSKQKYEPAPPKSNLIGLKIESKLSIKRLVSKITVEEGEIKELARDFLRYGGIILGVDKDNNILTVEVEGGTFTIPRYFVKKQR